MSSLYAKLFQHTNRRGAWRWISSDRPSERFSEMNFDNRVSSIEVLRGSDYRRGDRLRFYTNTGHHNYAFDLGPGVHDSIPYNDKLSSFELVRDVIPETTNDMTAAIVITLYEHSNYGGASRLVLKPIEDLRALEFNNKTTSILIERGPDYDDSWRCDFYEDKNFNGPSLGGGIPFTIYGSTPYRRIKNVGRDGFRMNDDITSVRIWQE